MAIYHFQIRAIQRSKGRSVVQMAAYITALKLLSPRLGQTFGRCTEGDIIEIGCVGSKQPIQVLLAKAEAAEKRKNSIEGRHLIVALPRELTSIEQWKILTALAEEISRELGVPVVYALHDDKSDKDKPRNPHGHLIIPTRTWNELTKQYGKKTRALDVAVTGSVIIENFRAKWEQMVNDSLPAGVPKVSRLSHLRAGRNRIPRRHLGEVATNMERNGFRTAYGNWNRKVNQLNRIAAATAKVERALIPLPKQTYAEQQLQIRLDRELALAAANIAQMPPSKAKQTFGANPPFVTGLAQAFLVPNTSKAGASHAEERVECVLDTDGRQRAAPTKATTQVGPSSSPLTGKSTAGDTGPAGIGMSDVLAPKSLESELAVAFEAFGAPPAPEISPPAGINTGKIFPSTAMENSQCEQGPEVNEPTGKGGEAIRQTGWQAGPSALEEELRHASELELGSEQPVIPVP